MNMLSLTRRTLLRHPAASHDLASVSALAQTPPGVLIVGQIAEPKSLDPAATAVNDFRILMNLYDGLVRYKDGTLEVEPRWRRVDISDDGLEYSFTLREGVSFHDGSAFDAEAVEVQLRPHARREPPLPRHRAVPAVVLLLCDRRRGGRWTSGASSSP